MLTPATTDQAAVDPTVLAASKDPSHPKHHFSLGQVLATMLLGAEEAFDAYKTAANIPADINAFIAGFVAIWLSNPTTTASTNVPVAETPANQ